MLTGAEPILSRCQTLQFSQNDLLKYLGETVKNTDGAEAVRMKVVL